MTPGHDEESDETTNERGGVGLRGHRTLNAERSESRRNEVLHAAARVFGKKGYVAARVDDVAAEMGVTKGVIYYYFRSKEEIFVEVMANGIAGAIKRLEAVLARGLPTVETLRLAIQTHAEYNINDQAEGYFAMLVASQFKLISAEGQTEVRRWQRAYGSLFQTILQRGMDEGVLVRRDIHVTQNIIINAANHAADWYRPSTGVSIDEASAHIADQLLGGVLADGTGRH